jgi:hypothetical protein
MITTHPENQHERVTTNDLPVAFKNVPFEVVFPFDNRTEEIQGSQSDEEDVEENVPTEDVIEKIDSVLEGEETSFDVEQDRVRELLRCLSEASNQQEFLIFVSRLYHLQNDTSRNCDEKLRIDWQQLKNVRHDDFHIQSYGPSKNHVDLQGEIRYIRYKKYYVK